MSSQESLDGTPSQDPLMEAAGEGSRAVYTRPVLETFGAFTAITRRVHTSGRWDGAFSGKTRT